MNPLMGLMHKKIFFRKTVVFVCQLLCLCNQLPPALGVCSSSEQSGGRIDSAGTASSPFERLRHAHKNSSLGWAVQKQLTVLAQSRLHTLNPASLSLTRCVWVHCQIDTPAPCAAARCMYHATAISKAQDTRL